MAGRLIRFGQRANRLTLRSRLAIEGFKRFGRTFGRQVDYQPVRLPLGTQILDNLTSPDGLATNHVNGISITRNPVLHQYGFKCGKRRIVGEKAGSRWAAISASRAASAAKQENLDAFPGGSLWTRKYPTAFWQATSGFLLRRSKIGARQIFVVDDDLLHDGRRIDHGQF
jgi:hypothetical protein